MRKTEVINSILVKAQNMFDVLSNENNYDYEFFRKLCGNFEVLENKCSEWVQNCKK